MSVPSHAIHPVQATRLRGAAVLADPLLNKDTAFTRQERRELGLEALLPWQEESLELQAERAWRIFEAFDDDLQKFAFAAQLRQSNLVLFYRFLSDHIEAVLPVVYTPTVGRAIQRFGHRYRSPSQGVYLLPSQQDRLETLLQQAAAGRPVNLVLVTDSEGILGIGDQGVGGIEICLGKLAVYTLCAGLHPAQMLPVVLDVGTDRQELLDDPLYPGLRQPRLRGEAYDRFIERFIGAVERTFPGCLLHWEDFGTHQARHNLALYRQRIPSFNDDIQGTSGVAAAAILAACRGQGRQLSGQRIVVFGAGTAGCGIADRLVRLLRAEGMGEAEARAHIWAIDRDGLLLDGDAGEAAAAFGRPRQEAGSFRRDASGRIGLLAVVEAVRPSVLIGTSTVAGAFTREVVETMLGGLDGDGSTRGTSLPGSVVPRPVILPLSNPTTLGEATPADLLAWSHGRALVATGSPFDPVVVEGQSRRIGQCNNCFLYPGLGFAAVAVGARQVSEAMIESATLALAERIPATKDPDAPLMPSLSEVQSISATVAEAVAITAMAEGLARHATTEAEALACLEAARWSADYGPVQAI
ncbi:NAD-dependent malic enzyme [Synechococcus sp. CBW1006]|uniref:NAD-dependent malic enzyme n=1 Tax=Synechococcus sp. CBW1006 TaxID=1353138 RepID=UPI001E57FD12|nr:NAD-dependent malic enzyme [Synechococcus sp. CBW1006]